MINSPFSLNRFEHEQSHIYYLPRDVFDILEAPKSAFLLGSRGTGKTTLLHALSWREQLTNSTLAAQLGNDFLSRSYIGLYLKLSLFQTSLFASWPRENESVQASVFAAYLDFIWIETLAEALAYLLAHGILKGKTAKEYELTESIIRSHPELIVRADSSGRTSLLSLGKLIHHHRRSLEKLALSKSTISDSELTSAFPLVQAGELGRTVSALVTAFCAGCAGHHGPWRVKVCFDEAECLDSLQQRVLNTVIRLTHSSLSYIVSYVRSMDLTQTILPNMSLQRADREIVPLDSLGDEAFLTLAEGVSKVRISNAGGGADCDFRVADVLGTLDINALLYSILATSEDADARKLLALAERLRIALEALDDSPDGPTKRSNVPPIYQAYIVERLNLPLPSDSTSAERRAQDSAEIRKRMVAAYLCICAELRKQVRYAFGEMLLQMSDKCVRDFLLQMDELFKESGLTVERFTRQVMPVSQQDAALRRAGSKKKEYVPISGVGAPTETLRLIDALGNLTARLQTTRYKLKGLRSSERGIFVLPLSTPTAESARTLQLITDASDAGFLKVVKQERAEWQFRVHCSLAAAYGFSYRGAYYPVEIRGRDLSALYEESDPKLREARLTQLEKWLGSDASGEMPLFEGQGE